MKVSRAALVSLLAVACATAATAGNAPPAMAQPRDCGPIEHGSLLPGEIVSGHIDDCHRIESWTFQGVRGQALMVSMEQASSPSFASIELDPVLRLFGPDSAETPVAENDDGGYGLNSLIQVILDTTGTFRIVATSITDTFGDFQLWYSFVGLNATDHGTIRPGETISGRIDATNPEDAWTFEGRTGQRVLIAMRRAQPLTLESRFLDPLLFLFRKDENGVDIVEDVNDDAMGEVDSLILRTLTGSGTYRIVATRIGQSFGDYTLTFQVEDAPR